MLVEPRCAVGVRELPIQLHVKQMTGVFITTCNLQINDLMRTGRIDHLLEGGWIYFSNPKQEML